jgi:DNA-binding CsgD family transcriptional regulator
MTLVFVLIALLNIRLVNWLSNNRKITMAVAGCVGTLGSASFFVPASGAVQFVVFGLSSVFVALFVALAFLEWMSILSVKGAENSPLQIAGSFALFSVIWAAVQAFVPSLTGAILVTVPAVASIAFWFVDVPEDSLASNAGKSTGSIKSLSWDLLIFCILFVYCGVLLIQVITTMQVGGVIQGGLSPDRSLATVLPSLILSLAATGFFSMHGYSKIVAFVMFIVLACVYMLSLLLIVLNPADDMLNIVSKRSLVAAEHCIEVLALIVLTREVMRFHLSTWKIFSIFGIVLCAAPQLLLKDILPQTSLFVLVEQSNLVVPVAAVSILIVALAAIGMLVWNLVRIVSAMHKQDENWQKTAFFNAMEGFGLTKRELDVASLACRGFSAKRISEELLLSESTVKAHLTHVYQKTGVRTKQNLIDLVNSNK